MAATKAATLNRKPHPDARYHMRHCADLMRRLYLIQVAADVDAKVSEIVKVSATLPTDPLSHCGLGPLKLRAMRSEIVEAFHSLRALDDALGFYIELDNHEGAPE